jgi:hypothetical protein
MKGRTVKLLTLAFLCSLLPACSEPEIYACADNQARLWGGEKEGSNDKGSQKYWNALSECSDKHKDGSTSHSS